jgi:hypothetical protein
MSASLEAVIRWTDNTEALTKNLREGQLLMIPSTLTERLMLEIRDLLREVVKELRVLTTTDIEEDGCSHPEQERVSLSSQGDLNHWICKVCRYDSKAGPRKN